MKWIASKKIITIILLLSISASAFAKQVFCPINTDFALSRSILSLNMTILTEESKAIANGWGISGRSYPIDFPAAIAGEPIKVIVVVTNTAAKCQYPFPGKNGTIVTVTAYHLNPDMGKIKKSPAFKQQSTRPLKYTCETKAGDTSSCPIEIKDNI